MDNKFKPGDIQQDNNIVLEQFLGSGFTYFTSCKFKNSTFTVCHAIIKNTLV